jgi:hypothetical protein
MDPSVLAQALPEAMGDVPGVCELPLTRAVVQYRDVHEMDTPGGRIEDIGLALVVEGRYPSSAECVDLGSGQLKVLDLSTELVVLDWVYEPTLDHVASLVRATAADPDASGVVRQYGLRLGLHVLERVGFGPLTRPTFLRIGFRDVCRDLDLHEGTSIRLVMGPGRLTRAHLDYDLGALVFRTAFEQPDAELEHALLSAFPEGELRRLVPVAPADALGYQVRLPFPETFAEVLHSLAAMRRGLASLMARFEPDRFRTVDRLLDTFGARETLGGLRVREPRVHAVRIAPSIVGSTAIH